MYAKRHTEMPELKGLFRIEELGRCVCVCVCVGGGGEVICFALSDRMAAF